MFLDMGEVTPLEANLARAAIIEQSTITCGAKTMEHAKTVWRFKLVAASPDK